MKKISMIIAAAASVTMLLSACEKDNDTVPVVGTPEASVGTTDGASGEAAAEGDAKAEVTAADITAAVMAEIELMSPVEKTIENIEAFYDIDTSTITDMSVFICGSGAYPDELAVFRFADKDSALAGTGAVWYRLESQIALYKDYTPDEVYKLEDVVIFQKDTWVIFAACSDNERANEIIEGLI